MSWLSSRPAGSQACLRPSADRLQGISDVPRGAGQGSQGICPPALDRGALGPVTSLTAPPAAVGWSVDDLTPHWGLVPVTLHPDLPY